MKIKVKNKSYEEVLLLMDTSKKKPKKPSIFFRVLLRVASIPDLKKTHFKYTMNGMEQLDKKQPCLILMNHSSFIDLEIAESIFYDRPLNIICTSDGFVGKEGLMRAIGCIPTNKFVIDVAMVKDMKYALHTLKSSVLMYPEASYSFDGTATPLPDSIGKCIKMLKVPVVMIHTHGAFLRDPLYNNLQIRKTDVSASVTYLLSKKQIEKMTATAINELLDKQFSFDNFKEQQEKKIRIDEPFRADHLERVLYKCPHCQVEKKMEGKGIHLTCHACKVVYTLDEFGYLKAENADTIFNHIPDWYRWQREEVKKEIEAGSYQMDMEVDICMMVNKKAIYKVGSGHLHQDIRGFYLEGCEGKLVYTQKPKSSYSLYSDYYWYELGDIICIGDMKILYYCFPKSKEDIVAKARIATEELYKNS